MVKEMAFIAYSVKDVPGAKTFYRDVVGLTPGASFGDHWLEFDVGNTTFGVGNGESLGFKPGESTGAAFEVDDVSAMRDRFRKAGIKVTEVNDFPGCYSCFVTDPEGNVFALHQRKPQ